MCWGSGVKESGEVISASAPYTSGWGRFVLLKMDSVRVARGGSLSTLHWGGVCSLGVLPGGDPTGRLLLQAVRILLECILIT